MNINENQWFLTIFISMQIVFGPPGDCGFKNPVFSQKFKNIKKIQFWGEISCRRLTHYQPHFLILLNIYFFIKNLIINIKKMSKNIPDIKKTFLKHLLNTFGIKNGWPPADRSARSPRSIFDDKESSKNVLEMFFYCPGYFLTFF